MNHEEKINQLVPDFYINATQQLSCKLSDFSGKKIVLFFYPKDSTPICTTEVKAFRDHFDKFQQLNTQIFGISRDNLSSHERFKAKHQLPFDLICDESEELCNYFSVIKMKNFFGKQIKGIERSTFFIDENRILRHVWRKVKVGHHINEVLKILDPAASLL